jgi:hypothetical protein
MAALFRNMQGEVKILLSVLQCIVISGDFIKLIYEWKQEWSYVTRST